MIAFFPQIYPDELLYSQIARYHAHSGYSNLVFTMTDIYKNANLTLPSVEFVNQYTEDAMKWITKNKSWEMITEQHTMYPAYIRFLPKQRKIEAVNGVIHCDGNWKKLMCLPMSGLVRNITKLYQDYTDFYKQDMPIMTQSYLQKIFNGYAYDPYFILQIAYFLGIPVQEITHSPNDMPSNDLHEIYQQLSAKHHIDYAIIEDIASTVMKFSNQKNRISQKSGPKAILYDELDAKYLPQVKNIIEQMLFSDGRPQKLSFAKIQKALNLPQKQLNKLPRCKAYIEQHLEPQEAFWAREVEWAVSVLMQENRPISRSRIMKMTNMRPNDLECCCSYIKNKETQALVQSLLNE